MFSNSQLQDKTSDQHQANNDSLQRCEFFNRSADLAPSTPPTMSSFDEILGRVAGVALFKFCVADLLIIRQSLAQGTTLHKLCATPQLASQETCPSRRTTSGSTVTSLSSSTSSLSLVSLIGVFPPNSLSVCVRSEETLSRMKVSSLSLR